MQTEVWSERQKGRDPLGRLSHRWDYNTEMHLEEMEWNCVDWIHLAQYTEQWRALCKHGNETSDSQSPDRDSNLGSHEYEAGVLLLMCIFR